MALSNEQEQVLERYAYDPWGKRRNPHNWTVADTRTSLLVNRGYTMHEHLDMFGIINMNGRVYDPLTAMFFSPDPYIQAPDNWLNFNRYAYCLNNPFKYTDPTGEWIHLVIGAIVGGVVNWATHGAKFTLKGLGYFGVGAAAGALGAGVGAGVNVAMAGGAFGAGFMGTAAGVSSTGFIAGVATGAASGFAGGFVTSSGNAWMGGFNFGEGLWSGVKGGGIGALAGGITGGLAGGIDALTKGTNFWTGKTSFDLSQGYGASGSFKIGEKTITGKYVGKFEDVNVFESKMLGDYYGNDGYSGVTLPERGIIVGKGVHTSGMRAGQAMMQHEYGHILQYRIVGEKPYYSIIAPESLASATMDGVGGWRHSNFWTETWANHLSKKYFENNWLGVFYPSSYPTQNISKFNLIRLLMAM
jgi:RHS repeat-associated protein